MNVELEADGRKVTIDAPYVRTPEEAEHVVKMAREALADQEPSATPRPFGFSVWADTERNTSGEVAEDAEAVG